MRKILLIFLFFASLVLFSTSDTDAACYCVDPTRCACKTPPPPDAIYPESGTASFAGIEIKCTDPRDLNSVFSVKDPVCDGRFNNEIPPSCAYMEGQPWSITCWGTGFVYEPLTIPPNTGGGTIPWHIHIPGQPNSGSPPIIFNGFSSDTNGNNLNDENASGGSTAGNPIGVTEIMTCHENVFCCQRTDVRCVGHGGGDPNLEITGGCGPKGDTDPSILPLCFGVPNSQTTANQGESRLWFSQAKLVAALSTMAQTMFAPFGLDNRYQETAISKNAPISDPSGSIDNQGALTSRSERYQGIHDDVEVVNQTDNNSSVIVGRPAPAALYSFDNSRENHPYDDSRACYIPTAIENPGDDLIGPRIKGELLFTEEFSFTPLPNTNCLADGESYVPAPGMPNQCCSQKSSASTACSPYSGGSCTGNVVACNGPTGLCCCPTGVSPGDNMQTCEPPEFIEHEVEGFTEVFSKSPLVEYIHKTVLDGRDSLYKTFFPINFWTEDDGTDKPFEEIPAKTGFKATVIGNVNSVTYAEGQATSPEVYFPHLGTLDKHWLVEFQTGLRPQGFARGAEVPESGSVNPFENYSCPAPRSLPDPSDPGIKCVLNCNSVSDSEILSAASAAGVDGQYFLDIKNRYIDLAESWVATGGANSGASQCYNDVVKRSLDAGINPIYSLAIWVQESGSSNYNSNVTFCDPNEPSKTVQDFGINATNIAGNFDAQLSVFLQLPYDYPNDVAPQCFAEGCNMANFSLIYQQGASGGCTINASALAYAYKTRATMNLFSSSCMPVYPTDLRCP